MPIDYKKYAPNWKEISKRIRERDGNKCKFCGVSNKALGARDISGKWRFSDVIYSMTSDQRHRWFGREWPKIIQIVLTVAHLDHDTTNNSDDNLAALCQKCHLNYDHEHHVKNAKATRAARKQQAAADSGQLEMEL